MTETVTLDSSSRTCSSCGRVIPPDAAGGHCPSCMLAGALGPLGSDPVSSPGRRCGDFELVEEIGRGGMGVVWKARQISLGREVALKMILNGEFATDLERRRFQAEAQAAAALDHNHIVPIFEVGEMEGHPFYAMKWVQGGSLAEQLTGPIRPPREAVTLMTKIARGVHHAHQHGILHRDLKPGNVLLEAGEPMIADFGLAKRLGRASEVTLAGSVFGSPNYMAPEQAEGRGRDISTATDVYSLGAILFHLLTHAPPFQCDSPLGTLKLVIEADPPSPRAKNAKVDRDLETICLKCLAKEPSRRYSSADALREDLERWLRREPVLARRAPPWERAWKWTRRHPAIAAGVLAVAFTATLGAAAVRAQFRQTQAALARAELTALAERSARAAVIEPNRIERFEEEVRVVSLSPDGQKVLVASGTNAYILDFVKGNTLHTLSGHTSFIRLAEWSRDGRRVMTASTCQQQPVWDSPLGAYGDQTVRVWDAKTGGELSVALSPFVEPLSSVAINSGGDLVALGSVDGSVGVWEVDASNMVFSVQASTSQVMQVRFSVDGSRVLASSSGDRFWIHRKHPGGGAYGSSTFNEESLIQAFDVKGQSRGKLESALEETVPVRSSSGFRMTASLSSRSSFAFSPDGTRLATAAREPINSALWDAQTGERLFGFVGVTNALNVVGFSRDGRYVAAGCADRTARVWATADGSQVAVLQPHPREVILLEFSRDPRWLLTVCADNKVRVWDVENGVCVALLRGHRGKVRSAEFSADGEEIISGSADRTVRRWRWATFEQLAVALPPHADEIKSIRFSSDARRVVTASEDGTAQVSETSRGRLLFALDPKVEFGASRATVYGNGGGEMRDAVFSPDDSVLLTARSDPKLFSTLNPLRTLGPVNFSPKAQPFLPGRFWDGRDGTELAVLEGVNVAFTGVEFRPDGQRALLLGDEYPRSVSSRGFWKFSNWSYSHGGGQVGELTLLDVKKRGPIGVLDAGKSRLWTAAFHPTNGRILTATDSAVLIWSPDGEDEQEIPGCRGRDWTTFSPDGRWILSQDDEGFPALWDTESGERLRTFEGLGKKVWEAWFARGGGEVGALTEDGRLMSWDAATAVMLWEGTGSGRNTGVTVASPKGRWLASVVEQQLVDLWDLKERRLVRTIERHIYPVKALGFSNDGQWLGTGDRSGEAWLWPLRLAGIVEAAME